MDKFLPLIKSGQWAENAASHGVIVEPVVKALYSPTMPMLAYCLDQGENVAYLQHDSYDAESLRAIMENAPANLRQVLAPLGWQEIQQQKSGIELRFLAFTDHFNAAECLLLKERMQEAHSLLGARRLLACTPQRGLLLVLPYDEHHPVTFKVFYDVCVENFSSGESEAISMELWIVEQGEIKGIVKQEGDNSPSNVVDLLGGTQDIEPRSAQVPDVRLFLPSQIIFVSLFGTALAGILAIARNYKILGRRRSMFATLVAGSLLVPLSIWSFIELPRTSYDRVFPLATAIAMGVVGVLLQRSMINIAVAGGAKKQKISSQILVILCSLIILIPLVATMFYFVE
jgi:hypothetical protein